MEVATALDGFKGFAVGIARLVVVVAEDYFGCEGTKMGLGQTGGDLLFALSVSVHLVLIMVIVNVFEVDFIALIIVNLNN